MRPGAAGKIPGEGDGTEPGLKRKESLIHRVMGLFSRKGLSLGTNAEGRQAGRPGLSLGDGWSTRPCHQAGDKEVAT